MPRVNRNFINYGLQLIAIIAIQLSSGNFAMARSEHSQRITMPSGAQVHIKSATVANARGDVVYAHGATFPSDLSVFYKFDGRSWADALNTAGFNVWGFDFVGYGHSSRYDAGSAIPVGRAEDAIPQLRAVIEHIRGRDGGKKLSLLAHSWGTVVAASYASLHPRAITSLVLFGPVVTRTARAGAGPKLSIPSHYPLTAWAQYRRFVEDVPRGEAQVLSEAHFDAWAADFLATDLTAPTRKPLSVMSPSGPIADVQAMWSGVYLYNAKRITPPTLLIRGEWDSVCNDADAGHLLSALGSADKTDVKIDRATHLMHLESQRTLLHNAVNTFLVRVVKE
jgi:pimeloyl-ACP methyl ester carboxylesterase